MLEYRQLPNNSVTGVNHRKSKFDDAMKCSHIMSICFTVFSILWFYSTRDVKLFRNRQWCETDRGRRTADRVCQQGTTSSLERRCALSDSSHCTQFSRSHDQQNSTRARSLQRFHIWVPATGTRSPRIAYRQSAINYKLAPKPTPKPNPTLTLTLTLN